MATCNCVTEVGTGANPLAISGGSNYLCEVLSLALLKACSSDGWAVTSRTIHGVSFTDFVFTNFVRWRCGH